MVVPINKPAIIYNDSSDDFLLKSININYQFITFDGIIKTDDLISNGEEGNNNILSGVSEDPIIDTPQFLVYFNGEDGSNTWDPDEINGLNPISSIGCVVDTEDVPDELSHSLFLMNESDESSFVYEGLSLNQNGLKFSYYFKLEDLIPGEYYNCLLYWEDEEGDGEFLGVYFENWDDSKSLVLIVSDRDFNSIIYETLDATPYLGEWHKIEIYINSLIASVKINDNLIASGEMIDINLFSNLSTIWVGVSQSSQFKLSKFLITYEGEGDGDYIKPWYIEKSEGTINITNTTLIESNASGGATFNAYISNGCINGGGNSGWNFYTGEIIGRTSMFLRFENIKIPKGYQLNQGDVILRIEKKEYYNLLSSNIILDIYMNDIGDVTSVPTSISEYNDLELTSSIEYTIPSFPFNFIEIDVTSLVQQIIRRDDWTQLNSIMFIIKNLDEDSFYLKSYDFDENPQLSAKLFTFIKSDLILHND